MLERRIIIGLITSTEYIQQVSNAWNSAYLSSQMAKQIASWCLEYYDKYDTAPGLEIQAIYFQKLKDGLDKDIAEEIEQDILPSLSDEFESDKFNLNYLLDQTFDYFRERQLLLHSQEVQDLLDEGEASEAEKKVMDFKPLEISSGDDLDLSNPTVLTRLEKAWAITKEPLIRYPKQLGDFLNRHLVRGGFVALMSTEKRGKSWWLLDFALRGARQGNQVAFFQAGDMTEDQQLMRFSSYLTKKATQEKWSGKQYFPVVDCVFNQNDTCDKEVRECDFGIFPNVEPSVIRKETTLFDLIKAHKENPDYVPCHNCKEHKNRKIGAPWIQKVDTGNTLTVQEAQEAFQKFFIDKHRRFKLSTYANDTLTIKEIKAKLHTWEKKDGFVPDIIIIDYADLLVPEVNMEFRHQQNSIWKALRGLSQSQHCLLITVTQADADSYEQTRLSLKNFSEDKRKYAHVTAMYGLNQDPKDREKLIGIMRLNELVFREDAFSSANEVHVTQALSVGRPFLGSYN